MSQGPVFQKFGGLYQLRVASHKDLVQVANLPEPCWVATSAPCDGLAVDPVFTALIDTDNDHRIRCDEIREACRWTLLIFKEHSGLDAKSDVLKLGALNTQSAQGKKVHDRARALLAQLGNPEAQEISLADVRSLKAPENQAGEVERALLYQVYLLELCNNFVSFPRLYDYDKPSLFQMGTLFLGSRKLTFNIKVDDLEAHKTLAAQSQMFVLYCEITDPSHEQKFLVATAITAGDARRLHIGRRGVFRTRDYDLWDARVVDVIQNPVSLWEATKMPFVRIAEFLENQAEKITSQSQAGLEKKIDQAVTAEEKAKAASATRVSAIRDLMLSASVSFAALASAFAFVTKSLVHIVWWKVLLAFLGLLAILVVPLVALGASKLSRRNISAMLTASGWAINDAMYLRAGLGELFTRPRVFPGDSAFIPGDVVTDTVKEKGSFYQRRFLAVRLILVVLLLGLLAWHYKDQVLQLF